MTEEQFTQQLIAQGKDIAALWENAKSAHKRIDETDRITNGIHKLAANVETLALQVKLLTERMDSSIDRMEQSLKSQEGRIREAEAVCSAALRSEKRIAELAGKVEAIEREPATKWKELVRLTMTITAAAFMGGMFANIIG